MLHESSCWSHYQRFLGLFFFVLHTKGCNLLYDIYVFFFFLSVLFLEGAKKTKPFCQEEFFRIFRIGAFEYLSAGSTSQQISPMSSL